MQKKGPYQRTKRFTKRLEATFSSGPFTYRGILSDISRSGLFIRTNRGFAPGTPIDISIMMSDNKVSHVKGIVRRTIKTPLSPVKNGMGVELTEKDALFLNLLSAYTEESGRESIAGMDAVHEKEPGEEMPSHQEFEILTCPGCGVKNKVLCEKMSLGPKCGRCGRPLYSGSR